MKNVTPITSEMLARMERGYAARPELNVISNAISRTKLEDAAFVPAGAAKLRMDFSVTVPTTGITNQKQSGRCWMFATMNLLRERVVAKCGMKELALSGTYLAFYDKLEKCNNFFEGILHFADQDVDDRETQSLLKNPLPDGGQWDMAASLVRKYGIVPDWVMPETVHSTGTAQYQPILQRKLREDALELRTLARAGKDTAARREEMLAELYNALCILYGQPPRTFDFEYTDKDGNYHCHANMTPASFRDEFIGDDFDEYVVVIASPIHPVNRTFCQPYMGNVVEDGMFWLNLSQEELEDLTMRQLQQGEAVFFSCDCHPDRDRAHGYWDPASFQYGEVLGGMTFGMTKAERLATFESTMNHCMMFCGVNLDGEGQPNRWKIENSWGDESGQKGYFVGSEAWFKENVYQVTVRKSLLSDEQRALLAQEPIPMKLWDPLA
jgi:bleomycin hydrolase